MLTLLERLANGTEPILADLLQRRRAETESAPDTIDIVDWNNKPGWDNWNQKAPAWKKKRVYFTKKN
ncbi:hypothetical protein [Kribbella solani]|uniref:Uncharacterized protein n=1 Tax=Kribbella solani TaxID=236067 RepID=A0A841DUV1_9ACTN|nr:hypothetical protein [Kribbella solani]MBB5980645.1 hypothetical protein [Kribbella solani]